MSELGDDNSGPRRQHRPRQRRKNPSAKTAGKHLPLSSDSLQASSGEEDTMSNSLSRGAAISSSLERIHVPPRTPRSSRRLDSAPEEEVEMSLLTEDERKEAEADLLSDESEPSQRPSRGPQPMSSKDKRAIALLIVLCTSDPVLALLPCLKSPFFRQISYRAYQYVGS